MKFGRTLREKTLQEWRYYSVDYKSLKKALKNRDLAQFDSTMEISKERIAKFYSSKETWAMDYMQTLRDRVAVLELEARSNATRNATRNAEDDCVSSNRNQGLDLDETSQSSSSSSSTLNDEILGTEDLKKLYRSIGTCAHFKAYIYCKKSLDTFAREIDLLLEYLELNLTALSKIWKKYDKLHDTDLRVSKLDGIHKTHAFLNSTPLLDMKDEVQHLLRVTTSMENKPNLPAAWENRKVYTIGCFDLFHRGHSNILTSLREFGYYIVAGIHDDASYFKLKNKNPIDTLEVRMKNVKPFVDQLYVIPSTDPLPYIQAAVSQQDVDMGTVCYARGDDMLNFPARDWVESVMPVYFVPRTESCSSTLIRTIYHADCEELRGKAAFAKTRYDGKPVCEKSGEVLKLNKSVSCPVVSE